jgi:hypothetical protein
VKRVEALAQVQFPSFPSLRSGKLGNYCSLETAPPETSREDPAWRPGGTPLPRLSESAGPAANYDLAQPITRRYQPEVLAVEELVEVLYRLLLTGTSHDDLTDFSLLPCRTGVSNVSPAPARGPGGIR